VVIPSAETEVIQFAHDLIRIDTTNTGDPATTVGEKKLALYVTDRWKEVGIKPTLIESAPGRVSVIVRIPGTNPDDPAALWHAHSDVVPAANSSDWEYGPFAGEIRDGHLWGRGALDMKNMIAMQLAVSREWVRKGTNPPYDVVIAIFADEEAGSLGARYLVENHPELFEGCNIAIGEVGGFSIALPNGQRVYPVMAGEKGMGWAQIRTEGNSGHSAMATESSAILKLASTVGQVGEHTFPISLTGTMRTFLSTVAEALKLPFNEEQEEQILDIVHQLGAPGKFLVNSLRNTARPTVFQAGVKSNVVPAEARGVVDCRILPGQDITEFKQLIEDLAGDEVEIEWPFFGPGWENDSSSELREAIESSIHAEDPDALVVPYLMPASTDGYTLRRLGIDCFGFCPMRLAEDFNYMALFHGENERVPLEALKFGVRAFNRLFESYQPARTPARHGNVVAPGQGQIYMPGTLRGPFPKFHHVPGAHTPHKSSSGRTRRVC